MFNKSTTMRATYRTSNYSAQTCVNDYIQVRIIMHVVEHSLSTSHAMTINAAPHNHTPLDSSK